MKAVQEKRKDNWCFINVTTCQNGALNVHIKAVHDKYMKEVHEKRNDHHCTECDYSSS